MPVKNSENRPIRRGDDVRMAARKALAAILEQLAGFVLDTGLSTREFEQKYRIAVVRSAADRQRELTGRLSISAISASTGISRAEISRILKMNSRESASDNQQQATNRILSVWHEDPKYTDANGMPTDLAIFGSGASFDSLVRAHGRGVPVRAMLDELVRTGSVVILSSRKIRAKSLVAVDHGVGPRAVKAFGDRAADLLRTMLLNIRDPERFRFVSNIEGAISEQSQLPIFRKEVSSRGQNFLAGLRETLFSVQTNENSERMACGPVRVSVAVFYCENERKPKESIPQSKGIRKNFRRLADRRK